MGREEDYKERGYHSKSEMRRMEHMKAHGTNVPHELVKSGDKGKDAKPFVPILLNLGIDGANLAFEILQNLPEALCYTLRCESFQYGDKPGKPMKFDILDTDTGKKYVLDEKNALAGLELFLTDVVNGKLPGLEIGQALMDAGSYDSYATDCYVQYCLWGKAPYG